MTTDRLQHQLESLQQQQAQCRRCANMNPPAVNGQAVLSKIILVGQAPGEKEPELQQPFAWTAGTTLFKWFATLGVDEETFRERVYIAATCRCFPGKKARGGDRVPNRQEINNCSEWLEKEIAILQPELLLPVGKIAIERFLEKAPLKDQVGALWQQEIYGQKMDIIPLPHPSGASTWYVTEPGKSLLSYALEQIEQHPTFQATFKNRQPLS